MSQSKLFEAIRIAAGLGGPAITLLAAMAYVSTTMGVAGAAAITAALALLGGPAGMYGGLIALPLLGILSTAIARYGIEVVLIAVYKQRIEKKSEEGEDILEDCLIEVDGIRFLTFEQKQRIKKAIKGEFTIMLIGKTGTGKSSTINNLIGKSVANTGDTNAVTEKTQIYETTINDIRFKVIDTPGLCDSSDVFSDEKYLDEIKKQYKDVDLTLFVTNLNETRVSRDEKVALRKLTSSLGENIWQNLIVVFTFACSPLPSESSYSEFLAGRTEALQEFIEEIASKNVAQALPFIGIDNLFKKTPDGKVWLPELFTLIAERAKDQGLISFFQALGDDVNDEKESQNESSNDENQNARIPLDDEQKERVKKSMRNTILGNALAGGLIGLGGVILSPILGVVGVPTITTGAIGGGIWGLWKYLNRKK